MLEKSYINPFGITVDEKLVKKLLEKEFEMRAKQPEPWTKTKYRPYAKMRTKKSKKD